MSDTPLSADLVEEQIRQIEALARATPTAPPALARLSKRQGSGLFSRLALSGAAEPSVASETTSSGSHGIDDACNASSEANA